MLEGTVRPDVLEAIFDKEPLFSRATPGDLLLDEAEREYDESVRNKIREQVNDEPCVDLSFGSQKLVDRKMIVWRFLDVDLWFGLRVSH